MNNLHRTLFMIIFFSLLGIVSSAKAITVEYLDEMMDEDNTRPQIKGKAKIAKFCNSLTRYGFTSEEVNECIQEKSQYHKKEAMRTKARNECLQKHLSDYPKIVKCVQSRYKHIRNG